MALVADCTDKSAPNSNGRCKAGEQKLLSTTKSAPAAWAISASAAKSAISFKGLDGVSKNSILVFGRNAACHSAKSVCDTKVTSIPKRVTWFMINPMVVPNRLRLQIK